jgi:hypothetical protein
MESFQQTCFGNDFLRLVNIQPLKKEYVRAWNMFLLNLSKLICKNVFTGLKSRGT